jgi:hypothetical protein
MAKSQTTFKIQKLKNFGARAWGLEFEFCLGLGIWDLFGIWTLGFGAYERI